MEMIYLTGEKTTGFEKSKPPVRDKHKETWKSCNPGPSTGDHWK